MLISIRQVDGVSVQLQINLEKKLLPEHWVFKSMNTVYPVHEHGTSSPWTQSIQSMNMVYPVHEHGASTPWTWYVHPINMLYLVYEHAYLSTESFISLNSVYSFKCRVLTYLINFTLKYFNVLHHHKLYFTWPLFLTDPCHSLETSLLFVNSACFLWSFWTHLPVQIIFSWILYCFQWTTLPSFPSIKTFSLYVDFPKPSIQSSIGEKQ